MNDFGQDVQPGKQPQRRIAVEVIDVAHCSCGVAVVDLRSGQTAAMLEFQTALEEIFDVQLLAGARFPEVLGFQKDAIDHNTFIVPPDSPKHPRPGN